MLLYLPILVAILPSVLGTAEVGFTPTSYTFGEDDGTVQVCAGVITGSLDPTTLDFVVSVMVDSGGTATIGKCMMILYSKCYVVLTTYNR